MDNNRRIEKNLQMIANELKEIRKVLVTMNNNHGNSYINKQNTQSPTSEVLDNQ